MYVLRQPPTPLAFGLPQINTLWLSVRGNVASLRERIAELPLMPHMAHMPHLKDVGQGLHQLQDSLTEGVHHMQDQLSEGVHTFSDGVHHLQDSLAGGMHQFQNTLSKKVHHLQVSAVQVGEKFET